MDSLLSPSHWATVQLDRGDRKDKDDDDKNDKDNKDREDRDRNDLVVWHGISVTYSLPVRQRA